MGIGPGVAAQALAARLAEDADKNRREQDRLQQEGVRNDLDKRKADQRDQALAHEAMRLAIDNEKLAVAQTVNHAKLEKELNENAQLPAYVLAVNDLNIYDPDFPSHLAALNAKYRFASVSDTGRRIAEQKMTDAGMDHVTKSGAVAKFPEGIQTKYRRAEAVLGFDELREEAYYDRKTGKFAKMDMFAVEQAVAKKKVEAERALLHPGETATIAPTGAVTTHIKGPTPIPPLNVADIAMTPQLEEVINKAGTEARAKMSEVLKGNGTPPSDIAAEVDRIRTRPPEEQEHFLDTVAHEAMQQKAYSIKAHQKSDIAAHRQWSADRSARMRSAMSKFRAAEIGSDEKTKAWEELEKITDETYSPQQGNAPAAPAAPQSEVPTLGAPTPPKPGAAKATAPKGGNPMPKSTDLVRDVFSKPASAADKSASQPQASAQPYSYQRSLDDAAAMFPRMAVSAAAKKAAADKAASQAEQYKRDTVAFAHMRRNNELKAKAESAAKSFTEMFQPDGSGKDWLERRADIDRELNKNRMAINVPEETALSEAADRKYAFEQSLAELGHTPVEIAQLSAQAQSGETPQFEMQPVEGGLPKVVAKLPQKADDSVAPSD